jgi:hypothetical protein
MRYDMKTLIALAVSGLLATSVMANVNKEISDETDKVLQDATSTFVKLDVDSDSNLTEMEITEDTELTTLDTDAFAKADINQDGKLNHDEFFAWFKIEEMGKQYSSARVEDVEDPMNIDIDEDSMKIDIDDEPMNIDLEEDPIDKD